MPSKVTKRPMFRGRVDARNPMGILASSAKLANSVAMAHGGFRNPHPPVKYARTGTFEPATISSNQITSVNPVNFGSGFPSEDGSDFGIANIDGGITMIPSGASNSGGISLISSAQASDLGNDGGTTRTYKETITPLEADPAPEAEGEKDNSSSTPDQQTAQSGVTISQILQDTNMPDSLKKQIENKGKSGTAEARRVLGTQQTALETERNKLANIESSGEALIKERTALAEDKAKSTEEMVDNILTGYVKPSDAIKSTDEGGQLDLDGLYSATAKEFGYEVGKDGKVDIDAAYEDKRVQNFWISLMKAGLATAAGESSDGLTNLAKGLGLGLNDWAKADAQLNQQQREDKKEFRDALRQNVKDEKSMLLTNVAAENNWLMNSEQLKQQARNAQNEAELAKINQTLEINNQQLRVVQMNTSLANAEAQLGMNLAEIMNQEESQRIDSLYKLWEISVAEQTRAFSMLSDDMKTAAYAGFLTFDADTKAAIMSPQYKLMLLQEMMGSNDALQGYTAEGFIQRVVSADLNGWGDAYEDATGARPKDLPTLFSWAYKSTQTGVGEATRPQDSSPKSFTPVDMSTMYSPQRFNAFKQSVASQIAVKDPKGVQVGTDYSVNINGNPITFRIEGDQSDPDSWVWKQIR